MIVSVKVGYKASYLGRLLAIFDEDGGYGKSAKFCQGIIKAELKDLQ